VPDEPNNANPLAAVGAAKETPKVKAMTLREYMVKKKEMKLVRLRIQNLDR
jgi:hypothetical protein